MSAPSAKRRRVDAATKTLLKPFRSPLMQRDAMNANPVAPAPGCPEIAPKTDGAVASYDQTSAALPEATKRRQRETARWNRDIEGQMEVINQARRIEEESQRRRPGQETDAELKELIAKWKAASRQAAEELFGISSARIAGAGGYSAWRQMQHEEVEFFGSSPNHASEVDFDSPAGSCGRAALGKGPDEFTMAMMLRSMNVEFGTIGYDEKEESWTDE